MHSVTIALGEIRQKHGMILFNEALRVVSFRETEGAVEWWWPGLKGVWERQESVFHGYRAADSVCAQTCPTLCDPMDCSPLGSSMGRNFPGKNTRKESESEIAQSFPTLCDPMDCSIRGSSIHGIFQARVLQ